MQNYVRGFYDYFWSNINLLSLMVNSQSESYFPVPKRYLVSKQPENNSFLGWQSLAEKKADESGH